MNGSPLILALSVGAQLDPGDHAFLSYGPVSNDDLLQYYGFVERENPADTYVLEDMGKWLKEVGVRCSCYLVFHGVSVTGCFGGQA